MDHIHFQINTSERSRISFQCPLLLGSVIDAKYYLDDYHDIDKSRLNLVDVKNAVEVEMVRSLYFYCEAEGEYIQKIKFTINKMSPNQYLCVLRTI